MRFAILPCLLVLAACGQTGPLYHPGSKPPPGHGSVLPAATRPAAPSAPSAPAPAAAPGTPAAPASDPVKPDEDKVKDKDDASPGAPAATTPAPEPAQP